MATVGGRTRYPHIEDGYPVPWVVQRMTLDAFLDLPDVKPYLEYDDGIVRQKVAPTIVHGSIAGFLVSAMNQVAQPRRLGKAYPETRFRPPDWAPVPDVSYYRHGRIRRRGGKRPEDLFEAPDIAVEIVSPDQSGTELVAKCLRYLSLGTTIALIVDPAQEAVFSFRTDQPTRIMRANDLIALDGVLPDFQVTVREMFEAIDDDWPDDEIGEVDVSGSGSAESK